MKKLYLLKNHKSILFAAIMCLISMTLFAQNDHDYHLEAYKNLAAGDCERAQKNYNVYKEMNKDNPDFTPDKELEYQIKLCMDHSKPLYAKDFEVYRDGKKLPDSEVRRLFANTKSFELYDKGMKLSEKTYSTAYGFSLGIGITSITVGGVFQAVYWPLYVDNQTKIDDYEYRLSHYTTYYNDPGHLSQAQLQRYYDETLAKAEKERRIAVTGLWLIGGGAVLLLVENLWERSKLSSGRTQIQKAVDLYNNGDKRSQTIMEIDYGLTGNGVNFTLSF